MRPLPTLVAFCLAVPLSSCAAAGDAADPNDADGDSADGAGGVLAGSGAGGDSLSSSHASSASSASAGGGSPCMAPRESGGAEVCDDGIDQDGDGFIDEDCSCEPGAVQSCYLGGSLCECKLGEQHCVATQEFGQWGACIAGDALCAGVLDESCEICGNASDDDCDGQVDEQCVIDVTVDIEGDCVTASCPPQAPYPIGCNISMAGNDARGCVANAPGDSVVYFQEGDKCGVGKVTGTLSCSSVQGPPLDAANCAINKSNKFYPSSPSGCPDAD